MSTSSPEKFLKKIENDRRYLSDPSERLDKHPKEDELEEEEEAGPTRKQPEVAPLAPDFSDPRTWAHYDITTVKPAETLDTHTFQSVNNSYSQGDDGNDIHLAQEDEQKLDDSETGVDQSDEESDSDEGSQDDADLEDEEEGGSSSTRRQVVVHVDVDDIPRLRPEEITDEDLGLRPKRSKGRKPNNRMPSPGQARRLQEEMGQDDDDEDQKAQDAREDAELQEMLAQERQARAEQQAKRNKLLLSAARSGTAHIVNFAIPGHRNKDHPDHFELKPAKRDPMKMVPHPTPLTAEERQKAIAWQADGKKADIFLLRSRKRFAVERRASSVKDDPSSSKADAESRELVLFVKNSPTSHVVEEPVEDNGLGDEYITYAYERACCLAVIDGSDGDRITTRLGPITMVRESVDGTMLWNLRPPKAKDGWGEEPATAEGVTSSPPPPTFPSKDNEGIAPGFDPTADKADGDDSAAKPPAEGKEDGEPQAPWGKVPNPAKQKRDAMLKLKARLDEEAIEQQVGIFLLPTEEELKGDPLSLTEADELRQYFFSFRDADVDPTTAEHKDMR